MAWSSETKASPANVRRRILAARDALQAARELAEKHGGMKTVETALRNADSWSADAYAKAGGQGRDRR